MTKRLLVAAAMTAVLFVSAGCAEDGGNQLQTGPASENPPAKSAPAPSALLSAADVEKVSGLTDLTVVPYDPAVGAGGDVNVADLSGQLVVMMVVADAEAWDLWTTDGFTVGEPVSPPVGDESFIGPNPDMAEMAYPYIFGFIKGDVAITLSTYVKPAEGQGTMLTMDQMRDLAEVLAARL